MASIPLPALDIKQPQDNPIDMFARILQVKSYQQQGQIGRVALQQAQEEQQDDQKWRSVFTQAADHPEWTTEDLLKQGQSQGVGPKSYASVATRHMQHLQALTTLGSDQLKLYNSVWDQTRGMLQDISDAPDSQKLPAQQAAKTQALSLIQNTKGMNPAIQQNLIQRIQAEIPDDQYMGDDRLALLQGEHNVHDVVADRALKAAQTAEATGKGQQSAQEALLAGAKVPGAQAESTMQQQQAALSPQQRALSGNLPYGAATGVPGAQKAVDIETEQRKQTAIAQVQAQSQMYAGNSALSKVPPHLVAPATAEATKLGTDYATFSGQMDNLRSQLSAATTGDQVAAAFAPIATALGSNSFYGTHRLAPSEVSALGPQLGSIGRQINTWFDKAGKGQLPPQSVQEFSNLVDRLSDAKSTSYQTGLNVVNQNYGSNFQPVKIQSANGPAQSGSNGPAQGYTRIKASDGSMHDLPTQNIGAARQRDPGLQVIQ